MAFQIKRKESVQKAVRRIGTKKARRAIRCLDHWQDPESIHQARKQIKKLRALLRLVRASISGRCYRRCTRALQEAAEKLTGPRDAHVRLQAYDRLLGHFGRQAAGVAPKGLRRNLQQIYDEESRRFWKQHREKGVKTALFRCSKLVRELRLDRKGWKAIEPGLKQAYRQGQRGLEKLTKRPSDDRFHQWRKRVKTLWYQVLLLRRVWPEQMCALAADLERLGECLGDDHDLVLLKSAIASAASPKAAAQAETFCELLVLRQGQLRSTALTLGERLFAEKPSGFSGRLCRYWHVWRAGKRSLLNA